MSASRLPHYQAGAPFRFTDHRKIPRLSADQDNRKTRKNTFIHQFHSCFFLSHPVKKREIHHRHTPFLLPQRSLEAGRLLTQALVFSRIIEMERKQQKRYSGGRPLQGKKIRTIFLVGLLVRKKERKHES